MFHLTKRIGGLVTAPFRPSTNVQLEALRVYTAWQRLINGHTEELRNRALLYVGGHYRDVTYSIDWTGPICAALIDGAADGMELRYQHSDRFFYMVYLQRDEIFEIEQEDTEEVSFAPKRKVCRAYLTFERRGPTDVTELIFEYAGPEGNFQRPVAVSQALWRVFDQLCEASSLEILDSWGFKHEFKTTATLENIF